MGGKWGCATASHGGAHPMSPTVWLCVCLDVCRQTTANIHPWTTRESSGLQFNGSWRFFATSEKIGILLFPPSPRTIKILSCGMQSIDVGVSALPEHLRRDQHPLVSPLMAEQVIGWQLPADFIDIWQDNNGNSESDKWLSTKEVEEKNFRSWSSTKTFN